MYIYILLFSSPFNHLIVLDPGMYRVQCILYSLWTCIFSSTGPPSTIHWYVHCTVYVHVYSQLFPFNHITCKLQSLCTFLFSSPPQSIIYLYWNKVFTLYNLQCTVHVHIYSLYCILLPYICTGLRSVSSILRIPEFLHNYVRTFNVYFVLQER